MEKVDRKSTNNIYTTASNCSDQQGYAVSENSLVSESQREGRKTTPPTTPQTSKLIIKKPSISEYKGKILSGHK